MIYLPFFVNFADFCDFFAVFCEFLNQPDEGGDGPDFYPRLSQSVFAIHFYRESFHPKETHPPKTLPTTQLLPQSITSILKEARL